MKIAGIEYKTKARFINLIRIELAQIFDFDLATTLVCNALASYTEHAKNKADNAGVPFDGWIVMPKDEIRAWCLTWVSLRKIDDAVKDLGNIGILTIDRRMGGFVTRYRLDVEALTRMVLSMPGGFDVPAVGTGADSSYRHQSIQNGSRSADTKEYKEEENIKEREEPSPPSETLRVLRSRLKGLPRVKWNKQTDSRVLTWLEGAGAGISLDRILAALAHFAEQDYWREFTDIPAAFLKAAEKYQDDSPTAYPADEAATVPIVAPRAKESPGAPSQKVLAPAVDEVATYISRWNQTVTSSPIRVKDPELERLLASLVSDTEFTANFDEICRLAADARVGGEAGYVTLEWLVRKGTWRKLLNGSYQFKKTSKGKGGAGERILREMEEKKRKRLAGA